MPDPKLSLSLCLVQQDKITIQAGQVPVISWSVRDKGNVRQELVPVLNFLRSGCPKVQLALTWGKDAWDTNGKELLVTLRESLQFFQLSDEEFFVLGDWPILAIARTVKQ